MIRPQTYRRIIRWLHIIEASCIGAYCYSPLIREADWSLPLLQYILFPLLGLSGLAMWQQGRVLRLLNRLSR